MEHLITTIIVAFLLLILMQWPIRRICRINPAIGHWKPVIIGCSVLWAVLFVVRVHFLAEAPGARADSIVHEIRGHEIAKLIRDGDFEGAWEQGGVGNYGFEFVVGVIYALTEMPEPVLMGIFTLMAFSGLLTLLDVLVRGYQAARVPFWLVAAVCAYPEGIFFASDTLKEGPVLWGACTMLRLLVPDPTRKSWRRWLAPCTAAAIFMFLRPHIALIWLVAIGTAQIIRQKRWGLGLVTAMGICIAGLFVFALAPTQINAVLRAGLLSTLESSANRSGADVGGSQIFYDTGAPIPEVTGLGLLFLRPFPWEAPHWIAFLAGVEVWFLTAVMIISWLNLTHWSRYMFTPLMLTALIATLLMAFIFSYMPNLGLVVRQRIQFFPALIILAATPGLIRRSPSYLSQFRRNAAVTNRPAMHPKPVTVRPAAFPSPRQLGDQRLPSPRRTIAPPR